MEKAEETNNYSDLNRKLIVDYYRSGIQTSTRKRIGVEVEHFIVDSSHSHAIGYFAKDGKIGVEDILEYLAQFYPARSYSSEGCLMGLSSAEGTISLEPAAQLELSIAPYETLEEVKSAYRHFQNCLEPFLKQHGLEMVNAGYHPFAHAYDLELIPKKRYQFMNFHFKELGTFGYRMMRASASTQVSVDYTSEADAVRKLRIASALGPVLGYLARNTSVFEAKPNENPLARLKLWRNVDNDRCRVVPGIFEAGFDFGAYADWMLNASPIFITRNSASTSSEAAAHVAEHYVGYTAAAEAYGDAPLSTNDIEHLISMFWPDARLKHFVEIRPADSLPLDRMLAYAALIKGIFYSEASLCAIEQTIGVKDNIWPLSNESVEAAIESVCLQKEEAKVYAITLKEWIGLLFSLAQSGLEAHEAPYLKHLKP